MCVPGDRLGLGRCIYNLVDNICRTKRCTYLIQGIHAIGLIYFYARYCFLKCSVSELIVAKSGFSHYSQFKDNAGLESHTSTLSLLVSSSANLYIQFGPRAELIVIFVKGWGWEGYLRSRPNGKNAPTRVFFFVF